MLLVYRRRQYKSQPIKNFFVWVLYFNIPVIQGELNFLQPPIVYCSMYTRKTDDTRRVPVMIISWYITNDIQEQFKPAPPHQKSGKLRSPFQSVLVPDYSVKRVGINCFFRKLKELYVSHADNLVFGMTKEPPWISQKMIFRQF